MVRTLVRRVTTDGHSVAVEGAFDTLSMSLALQEPDTAGAADEIVTTRL